MPDIKIIRVNTGIRGLQGEQGEQGEDGAGSSAFTDLSDVPATYSGSGLKVVRVNAGATALEFATISGGSLSDADYGDIVVSGSGTVMTYDGVVPVAKGGTGQTTEAEALGEMTQALSADATPDATADYVMTYDASADTGKKVLLNNIYANTPLPVSKGGTGQTTEAEALGEMIQALSADASPVSTTDYVVTYDASADTGKKVLIEDIQIGREVLTAARIYYVRKDGSDSNNGLANTAGGAFLTIGKALDEIGRLDVGIGDYASYLTEVRVGAGTYTETLDLPQLTGAGLYSDDITGSEAIALLTSTSGIATDVIVDGTTGQTVRCTRSWGWLLHGITFTDTGGGGRIIAVVEESILRLANVIIYGQASTTGVQIYDHSEIYVSDNSVTFKGSFGQAIDVQYASIWYSFGRNVLLSGTVSCSTAFVTVGHTGEYYGNSLVDASGTLAGSTAFTFQNYGGRITTDNPGAAGYWDFGDTDRWGNADAGQLERGGMFNGLQLTADPSTYADLPTVPQHGMLIPVTNAIVSAPGATISTGGGSEVVMAYHNGTTWNVAGSNNTNHLITSIGITIDGGGSAITTGVKGYVHVPYNCTLNSWTLLGDTSGAIKIDVWREDYPTGLPDNSDSITNAHEPEITASGTKAQDTSITDWTSTAILADDIIGFNVDSCTSITRATLVIKATKT